MIVKTEKFIKVPGWLSSPYGSWITELLYLLPGVINTRQGKKIGNPLHACKIPEVHTNRIAWLAIALPLMLWQKFSICRLQKIFIEWP